MELHLKVIGVLLIALALVHVIFPKYFHWREQLYSLSIMNRQMMYIHSFFIAFTVMLMGLLCITSTDDLINTGLGRRLCFGMGVFWTIRLLIQFFGYSPMLWKGKLFETAVHILFSVFWTYLSVVFFMICVR